MSTSNSEIDTAKRGGTFVIDNESGSIVSNYKNSKHQASCKKFQFQEEIPFMDEDCDACGEVDCHIPRRRPHEMVVARIPTKVELKSLTHLAKRPAIDIEFQDLSYSVRNPGRREGKPGHRKLAGN
jgi:hypothetical protein